jgi:uncharacterized protein
MPAPAPTADPGRWGGIAVALAALAVAAAIIGLGPRLADAAVQAIGIVSPAGGEATFTALVFGSLAVAGVIGGALTDVRSWQPGLHGRANLAIGSGIGLAAFALAVGMAALAGTLGHGAASGADAGLLAVGACVVLVQVAAEELYFRGWLQPLISRAVGQRAAVAATGVAFGLLHALGGVSGMLALANMIAGGWLFGALAMRGGGIAGAIGAHSAWNLAEQLGVGLDPNPGVGSFGALVDWDLVGRASWGGSADGLNASWAMLIALTAVLVPFALLPGRQITGADRAVPDRAVTAG